jgi:hypothetical protein
LTTQGPFNPIAPDHLWFDNRDGTWPFLRFDKPLTRQLGRERENGKGHGDRAGGEAVHGAPVERGTEPYGGTGRGGAQVRITVWGLKTAHHEPGQLDRKPGLEAPLRSPGSGLTALAPATTGAHLGSTPCQRRS